MEGTECTCIYCVHLVYAFEIDGHYPSSIIKPKRIRVATVTTEAAVVEVGAKPSFVTSCWKRFVGTPHHRKRFKFWLERWLIIGSLLIALILLWQKLFGASSSDHLEGILLNYKSIRTPGVPFVVENVIDHAGKSSGWKDNMPFMEWYNSHPDRTYSEYNSTYIRHGMPHPSVINGGGGKYT